MRFGSTSMTVTGTVSPASVKMRVMPALRPMRATLMTFLSFSRATNGAPERITTIGDALVARPNEGTLEERGRPDGHRDARVVLGSARGSRPTSPDFA